jgi:hypothetical protein
LLKELNELKTEMLLQNFNRVVAWLVLSVSVVLTVVPPVLRPSTFIPHEIEHAAIFLTVGNSGWLTSEVSGF